MKKNDSKNKRRDKNTNIASCGRSKQWNTEQYLSSRNGVVDIMTRLDGPVFEYRQVQGLFSVL